MEGKRRLAAISRQSHHSPSCFPFNMQLLLSSSLLFLNSGKNCFFPRSLGDKTREGNFSFHHLFAFLADLQTSFQSLHKIVCYRHRFRVSCIQFSLAAGSHLHFCKGHQVHVQTDRSTDPFAQTMVVLVGLCFASLYLSFALLLAVGN